MWPFKSKYDKLKREDVVSSIVKLEQEEARLTEEVESTDKAVKDLMEKGRATKDLDMRKMYVKKVNMIKAQRQNNIQRIMYLMYNISLLEKLKDAIDDNTFFAKTSGASLGNLLADQMGLAKFLNKALNTKVKAEDVLTSADDTFKAIQEEYTPNAQIYGMSSKDEDIMSFFEEQDMAMDMDIPAEIEQESDTDETITTGE